VTYRIGTDVGGTFTDLVLLTESGEIQVRKASTTPADRTTGMLDALRLGATDVDRGLGGLLGATTYFAHGTTAATNAFLERRGARTALITTRGFADVLRLQRSMGSWAGLSAAAASHYSARTMPEPIIDQADVAEVDERVDYSGSVLVPLNKDSARESISWLAEKGIRSFAVSLLWSFRNPSHEQMLAALIHAELPDAYVTLSSDLIPILGEYERTSTTAINSYLGPVMHRYLAKLDDVLREAGLREPVTILDSGGGVQPSAEAARRAASLLTSGPAGGVLASAKLAGRLGLTDVVTTDVGGTSFDVGLILGGEPVVEHAREIGRFHLALTGIRIETIGSGGGSIARVQHGHLSVGPHSAGAIPGPACYGRGGDLPTVTDADIILGIIDPDYFLGGQMTLHPELAAKAITEHVADPLGIDLLTAAAGIREVADNQMADVLRSTTLRAGRDPRDFTVFAFGGAGPTHAYRYAAAAGMSRIIVPSTATAHSALGCVLADRRRSFSRAFGQYTPAGFARLADHVQPAALEQALRDLEERCKTALGEDVHTTRYVGMRFRLQVHELFVPLPSEEITEAGLDDLVSRFVEQYEARYGAGTALRGSGIELTTVRVDGSASGLDLEWRRTAPAKPGSPVSVRKVFYFEIGQTLDTAIYHARDLAARQLVTGPAIIEYPGTTAVVGPDQQAEMDEFGNLTLTIPAARPSTEEGRS